MYSKCGQPIKILKLVFSCVYKSDTEWRLANMSCNRKLFLYERCTATIHWKSDIQHFGQILELISFLLLKLYYNDTELGKELDMMDN